MPWWDFRSQAESGYRRSESRARRRSPPLATRCRAEVHAWRQARPSHDFGIEWLALTFDEIIEVVLGQPLIQSCRTGDWRALENPSSAPTFPAAARGRVFL